MTVLIFQYKSGVGTPLGVPMCGNWTSVTGPALIGNFATGATLPDGRFILVQGDRTRTLDPSTLVWTIHPSNPSAQTYASGSVDVNGNFVHIGGVNNNVVSIFNATTNTWSISTSYPFGGKNVNGWATFSNGKVYMLGGATFSGVTERVYSFLNGVWSADFELSSIPNPRFVHSACTLNDGNILLTGGANVSDTAVDTVYLYNVGSNSWSQVTSMPLPRFEFVALKMQNGLVWVIGGSTIHGNASNFSEVYDPALNTWSTGPALPTGTFSTTGGYAGVLNDGRVMITNNTTTYVSNC